MYDFSDYISKLLNQILLPPNLSLGIYTKYFWHPKADQPLPSVNNNPNSAN